MNVPTLDLDHLPIETVSPEDVNKAGRTVVRLIGEDDRAGIADMLDALKINADTLAHGLHPTEVQLAIVKDGAYVCLGECDECGSGCAS